MAIESPDPAISEADADARFGEMLRDGLAKAGLGEGQRHPRLQTALELMRGERRRQIETLFNIVDGVEG